MTHPVPVTPTVQPNVLPPLADFRVGIEEALAYAGGTHTFEDIEAAVNDPLGVMRFWPGIGGSVIITEVIDYPRVRVLNFFLAAGTMAELKAMTPYVLAWGRDIGCTQAWMTGRRGWERSFLTSDDPIVGQWVPNATFFAKDMTHG